MISPAIGRWRMASSPSKKYLPFSDSVRKAVKKRAAVPAFPTCSLASLAGIFPARPITLMVWSGLSTSMVKPSCLSEVIKISVSRLKRAPRKRVSPSARAAKIRARFVILFDPGTWATPRAGEVNGLITIESLMGLV